MYNVNNAKINAHPLVKLIAIRLASHKTQTA